MCYLLSRSSVNLEDSICKGFFAASKARAMSLFRPIRKISNRLCSAQNWTTPKQSFVTDCTWPKLAKGLAVVTNRYRSSPADYFTAACDSNGHSPAGGGEPHPGNAIWRISTSR